MSDRTYSRTRLLSLAQTPGARPPSPARLASFSTILRRGSVEGDWGIDEAHSTILDGEPVSKALPVPTACGAGEVLFDYHPPPVMVDFTDPFRKASAAFQSFDAGPAVGHAQSLGEKFAALREGRSRSSSNSSESLNPFAPPFRARSVEVKESVPLPKHLPSSLPAKPSASLPPVFVKRESATLPQPMTVPDVAPLGEEWDGAMSGNERRRRASETPRSEGRPERLIRLGARLRESAGQQSMPRGVRI